MSGCGTSLKGRAVVEVYEHGMGVYEYDHWVKNYISVQQGVAEGRFTPEQADWSKMTFYLKDAGDTSLWPVSLDVETRDNGRVRVTWTGWDHYDDGEYTYRDGDGSFLAFEFDPYEGLERYTLTIVPRESTDEPIPESWNGKLLFVDPGVPHIYITQVSREVWDWIDSHTLDVSVSGDVLVTPYGEETGVESPIANREIAVRRAA